MSKNQKGFTLIEIVMVLVLLGILSAVAVPKYFDLRAQAEQKAAQAIVAEGQARLNATFAQNLLEGKTCSQALDELDNDVLDDIATDWGLTYTKPQEATDSSAAVKAETKLVHTVGTETTTYSSNETKNNLLKIQSLVYPTCAVTTTK